MSTGSFSSDTSVVELVPSRGRMIAIWAGRLVVAGILGMGAFMKFFNYTDEGSKALADALGVGRGAVTGIGVVETLAVILILLPWRPAVGALLAVGTMLGALLSHATILGFSGNPAAESWPLAIVVLAAASLVVVLRRRELPLIGNES